MQAEACTDYKAVAVPPTCTITPPDPIKAMAVLDRRFDVRMSPELAEQLNEVASENNMSRAEVFRRAVGLYKLAKEVERNQGKVLLEEPDKTVRQLVGL